MFYLCHLHHSHILIIIGTLHYFVVIYFCMRQLIFISLFKTLVEMYVGKAPVSIITDQDPTMKNEIEVVFPIIHHRYCSWHLGNNVMIHLKALKLRYSEFEKEDNQWIYGCATV